MSDDQVTTTEVPAPPAVPVLPQEAPESAPVPVEDKGAGSDTEVGSETVTDPAEVLAADPVVTTTPTGQSVTMPDGRVVYTRSSDAPVSNGEWQKYELTHQGDQLRYAFVPGDKEYTPYSDPSVPNSHLAQQVEREISSFAERVLKNAEAEVSYLWNALQGMHDGELDRAIATGGGSDKVMV